MSHESSRNIDRTAVVPPILLTKDAVTALASTQETLYTVQPVSALPTVDSSVTLGAALLGRANDSRLNGRIIRMTLALDRFFHVAMLGFCVAASVMILTRNQQIIRISCAIGVLSMLPIAILCPLSLSRDLVLLTTKTFEFWFLSSLVWVCTISSILMFNDERALINGIATIYFYLVILLDANIHSRPWLIRTFLMTSGAFVSGIGSVMLHYTPHLVHLSIPLTHTINMDVVDLCVHCYTTVAFFVVIKMFRSRRLVFSNHDLSKSIQCETYYPNCHLVPSRSHQPHKISSLRSVQMEEHSTIKQMRLVQRLLPGLIDANDSIIPFQRIRFILTVINLCGNLGLLCSSIGFYLHIGHAQRGSSVSTIELIPTLIGLVATLVFTMAYCVQAPRAQLQRLFHSLDAWFVSFQISVVTLGICDVVSWDNRTLFMLPPWLWCHWAMILDTLTPLSKQRLHFRRSFARFVVLNLFVYPIVLIYWIFLANVPNLNNRVLFSTTLFGYSVRMEVYSLLASRLVTFWIWMGRSLWREFFRLPNTFKLLKYRVEYQIGAMEGNIAAINPQG